MRGKREFPSENPPLQVGMPINKSYKKLSLMLRAMPLQLELSKPTCCEVEES